MADAANGPGLSRRTLLKVGLMASGGLAFGFRLDASADVETTSPPPGELAPNAWIRIYPDDRIELMLARSEEGQGVMTALSMLIAEELEVGLDQVRVVMAPVAPAYKNRLLGEQATGQSTSVRDAWVRLRDAGATARTLLIRAAASRWQVPTSECHAQRGAVHHSDGLRHLSYGALVEVAAGLAPIEQVALKSPERWRLLGTSPQRLDVPEKVRGRAGFGLDVRLPGLLFATLYRCPTPGSRVQAWVAAEAMRVPGVQDVFAVRSGVAVLADSTWAAIKGRDKLDVSCRPSSNPRLDTQRIEARLRIGLKGRSAVARKRGNVSAALASAAQEIEAIYQIGFQPHACMEPISCTADVRSSTCSLYVPTQAQEAARAVACQMTGLPSERVTVHTSFLGGGYGRRLEQDFVAEAVELSKAARRPVQVLWTREDDFRHDYFRPMTLHRLRGGIDDQGQVTAWFHRVVGPSVLARLKPEAIRDGIDGAMVEGAADLPYEIPALRVEYRRADTPAPIGLWRGGGYAHNCFAVECFIDELASLTGRDPIAMRRQLLVGRVRQQKLLDHVEARFGLSATPPDGRARGLALVSAFASHIAQVAEVSIEAERIKVHRVLCAVDCGSVLHPELVRSQIRSGIAYGLTAALKGEITFTDGEVDQLGFDAYPLLRFDEMPEVVVDLLPNEADPGGVSGLAVPGIAPAVANAVRVLTGKSIRSLPIRLGGL
ncbi:xanthine dehydrogenase family protein molybdopterin-binding subunit [Thiorhodococcus mannitoliphagus]|uniref:Xanthine dehydrogenase family protein molybdopterin-binding subunit n=1 Tax=Thiorhodococcus mannitoliphagus TaxID=329406 RepID=A0A6P1DT14_9GAMM|nr:molybdopterin cofactor-binding domain-containing protein [Thiorhodococcus mannitoliphagus]NEX20343.1 xanthine dehydrogenase family protein molybdopterin-binding subunit [Thiorhodococcus mannitoliphagus]